MRSMRAGASAARPSCARGARCRRRGTPRRRPTRRATRTASISTSTPDRVQADDFDGKVGTARRVRSGAAAARDTRARSLSLSLSLAQLSRESADTLSTRRSRSARATTRRTTCTRSASSATSWCAARVCFSTLCQSPSRRGALLLLLRARGIRRDNIEYDAARERMKEVFRTNYQASAMYELPPFVGLVVSGVAAVVCVPWSSTSRRRAGSPSRRRRPRRGPGRRAVGRDRRLVDLGVDGADDRHGLVLDPLPAALPRADDHARHQGAPLPRLSHACARRAHLAGALFLLFVRSPTKTTCSRVGQTNSRTPTRCTRAAS